MLGGVFLLKSRAEHDAIIRKMKFHRFLIDFTTFGDHIFTKNVILAILRDLGNFQYCCLKIRYEWGCINVLKIQKSQKSSETLPKYPGRSPKSHLSSLASLKNQNSMTHFWPFCHFYGK